MNDARRHGEASSLGITDQEAIEISRIISEYKRRERELPPDYYGWQRPANLFLHLSTVAACVRELTRARLFPLTGLRVLDVGCGRGSWLLEFCQWGAFPEDLAGIDLDDNRIAEARRYLPTADLRVGDARHLPWPDARFDLVTQFMVFTSILHQGVKRKIASEMRRVLKPGGVILWYDFRYDNPRNPHVRGIGAREIRSLFPGCTVRLRRVTLAPPIARRLVPFSWTVAYLVEKLPLLRTHYLGVIYKSST